MRLLRAAVKHDTFHQPPSDERSSLQLMCIMLCDNQHEVY